MSLYDRIFAEPELQAAPPVLVDVGAAGGIHGAWRAIARHSIGVGFEPDARDAAALGGAARLFRRWILCPGLVVPERPADGTTALHLTRSPQCSSTLPPRADALHEWAFAEFFDVQETRALPAATLADFLGQRGIDRIDWLKCDTQGLDLKIFLGLPAEWRSRVLALDFEPGVIDAYAGEDKLADVLTAMQTEPFWLADLSVGRTARGRPKLLAEALGPDAVRRVRQLGPAAPAWANLRFLRTLPDSPADRRMHLIGWVFAMMARQPAEALAIARAGAERFGGDLFARMTAASVSALRWAMIRGIPAACWRRLTRG
ncbi:MAG TPA: FkbM family methyltransferase [Candidatus Didemnitutus sp.]|nr:FkbM family methyltransferase [Candidatus Didemnitutus sp.]